MDVISFEFENVSAEGLDLLASLSPVRPAPAVLRISQYRVAEKSLPEWRRRGHRALGAGAIAWTSWKRRCGGIGPARGAEDDAAWL